MIMPYILIAPHIMHPWLLENTINLKVLNYKTDYVPVERRDKIICNFAICVIVM